MDWCRRALGVAVLVVTSVAQAQPGGSDSPPGETVPVEELPTQPQYSPPSDEAPPRAAYPRAATARPLLLPAGALEASLNLRTRVSDPAGDGVYAVGTAEVLARYGLGAAELQLGTALYLYSADNADDGTASTYERLQAVYAQARFPIARSTALGVQLTIGQPLAEYSWIEPAALIQHKLHFTEAAALELTGALTYEHGLDDIDAESNLFAIARVRLQMQVAPLVALEAIAELTYRDPLDEGEYIPDFETAQRYGVGSIISITPNLDLDLGVEILGTGDLPMYAFVVGVTGRRVP